MPLSLPSLDTPPPLSPIWNSPSLGDGHLEADAVGEEVVEVGHTVLIEELDPPLRKGRRIALPPRRPLRTPRANHSVRSARGLAEDVCRALCARRGAASAPADPPERIHPVGPACWPAWGPPPIAFLSPFSPPLSHARCVGTCECARGRGSGGVEAYEAWTHGHIHERMDAYEAVQYAASTLVGSERTG